MTGENKGYSRDYEAQWPPMRGRIRVKLFDADGKPTNPEITTRKELFVRVAELIPKMSSRQPGYVDPQQVLALVCELWPPCCCHAARATHFACCSKMLYQMLYFLSVLPEFRTRFSPLAPPAPPVHPGCSRSR